jgi:hypothetical protein
LEEVLNQILTKKCAKCKVNKTIEEFSKHKNCKDGLQTVCKQCHKEYTQNNKESIKQKGIKYRQKNKDSIKEYIRKNCLRRLLDKARFRTKRKNLQFDLTVEWLQERYTGRCELTGIEFQFGTEGRSPITPSLDRIDSSKGYTKDNIRIVIWALNRAIGEYGIDVYERIAKAYFRNKLGVNFDRV